MKQKKSKFIVPNLVMRLPAMFCLYALYFMLKDYINPNFIAFLVIVGFCGLLVEHDVKDDIIDELEQKHDNDFHMLADEIAELRKKI